MGVPIEENKFLLLLNYFDNQVVIAQDTDNLDFILQRLNKLYKEWSFKINFNKAEFITINTYARCMTHVN